MKKLILFISFIVLGITTQATVHVVDSLQSSGYGTLRAAVDSASNGDTIRFNPSLIASGSDSIVVQSEITFNKSLVFKGLYSATDTLYLSGGGTEGLFYTDSTSSVVFDSLVFRNGVGQLGQGGAVRLYNFDTCVISHCEFVNNHGNVLGGALYARSDLSKADTVFLTLKGNKFVGNSSFNGGALNVGLKYYYLEIEDCDFVGNTANHSGGAIHLTTHLNGKGSIEIDDVNVKNNNSVAQGGGFYYAIGNSVLSIYNSRFEGNEVSNLVNNQFNQFLDGGGLFVGGNDIKLNMEDCHISRNKILSDSASFGAGICVLQFGLSYINIKRTVVENNVGWGEDYSYGGGMYLISRYVDIDYSTISGNKSLADSVIATGGGIELVSPNVLASYTIATINHSTFIGNEATSHGGALVMKERTPGGWVNSTIKNSTFYQNSADSAGFALTDASTTVLNLSSNIIALNGANPYQLIQGQSLVSNGYNVLSDSIAGMNHLQDLQGQDSTQINLGPLQLNGGNLPTVMPQFPSVAINAGAPTDLSNAQNVPIKGVRDAGAAENCVETFGIDSIVACDAYTWLDGNTYYANDTSATHMIINAAGCDSLVQLHLTILRSTTFTDTISACGQYTWIDGQTYINGNTKAQHVLTNAVGCDSIVTLHLTLVDKIVETFVVCDSLTWRNGVTYYQSNSIARDTIPTGGVCDSIFILDLQVNNTESSTETHVVCDSLTWLNGATYYSSTNSVYDTLINRNGCDSIVNLDLTVNHTIHDTDHVSGCLFYMWSNGQIYVTDNNTATQVFNAGNGCDSILHLDLQIHQGTFATDTHVVCDSLVWIDGNTYYANNSTAIYTLVGGNSNGCDSVVTLNLTVNGSSSTDVINSCGTYTWIDGNTYTSSNNTATHTFTNTLGCDSVVTLNLTINGTTYGTETVSTCDTYTWNGITYTSSNNTATDTLVNSQGCDSIITLDLTIHYPTWGTDVVSSCAPFVWLDGNSYQSDNNSASITLTNAHGCDSVVTLDLTILPNTTGTDVVTSCTEITWIDGNVYSATTSGPTFTIPNDAGCDSVVTLDFTLLEVDTAVVRNYLTLTAQATNATYQWIDCDNGNINGETNAAFTATENGDYQVEVTQYGCVDTSVCFSITNVGIQQAQLLGVNVYPNPTSDVLHIDKGSNVSLEITVTNSAGAIVYHSSAKDQITTINMAKMASGVYVVTLRNELGVSVERIVKR